MSAPQEHPGTSPEMKTARPGEPTPERAYPTPYEARRRTMPNATHRSTKPTVLTIKEAAKRHHLQWLTVDEAIRTKKLAAIKVPAKQWWNGHLVSVADLDRWIDGLSARERLAVFPCTREGCVAQESHSPHTEKKISSDGRPIHGRFMEDNRPKMEDGSLRICNTGQPDPDSWEVRICAIGDEPWTVEVKIWAENEFPLRQERYVRAFYELPDVAGLLAALIRAQAYVDKLNAKPERKES